MGCVMVHRVLDSKMLSPPLNWKRLLVFYSAANAGHLYEVDPDFRSRLPAKERADDKTFGAYLRRLRLLRGLRQGGSAGRVFARPNRRGGTQQTTHAHP